MKKELNIKINNLSEHACFGLLCGDARPKDTVVPQTVLHPIWKHSDFVHSAGLMLKCDFLVWLFMLVVQILPSAAYMLKVLG